MIYLKALRVHHRAIKSLGNRVEQEHTQHLRDIGRIERQTATMGNGLGNGSALDLTGGDGEVDFEALVKGRSSTPNPLANSTPVVDPWDMDSWGSPDTSAAPLVSHNRDQELKLVANVPRSRYLCRLHACRILGSVARAYADVT